MGEHTKLPGGLGVANDASGASNTPVVSKPYIKALVIPIPVVASGAVQSIAVSTIKGWPTSGFQVFASTLNVVVAPTTGTTKTVSTGYTGANTAFTNAQTAAAAGTFAGAAPVTVDIAGLAAITYTLGSANWSSDAIVELILHGVAND
jgi:hypothetical protein